MGDRYLLSNRPGRLAVDVYSRLSPPIARFIGEHETLKTAARIGLLPLFALGYMTLKLGPAFTLVILLILLALPVCLLKTRWRIGPLAKAFVKRK